MSWNLNILDVFYESETEEVECSKRVASGRRVKDLMGRMPFFFVKESW